MKGNRESEPLIARVINVKIKTLIEPAPSSICAHTNEAAKHTINFENNLLENLSSIST